MNLKNPWVLLKELYALPEVTISLSGDRGCKAIYESFTAPHPRYRVISHKRWGVALLRLPDTFEEYLKGNVRKTLRTNRQHALRSGLQFEEFSPLEKLHEILSINASMQNRQGRAMQPDYLDLHSLREYFQSRPSIYGVRDRQGNLKAYADAPVCGDAFVFNRLLGHGDDLEHGIMYLLMSEVIHEMIKMKGVLGKPLWAMYDTFYGASQGLRYFKERVGFKPYRVRWLWTPQNG